MQGESKELIKPDCGDESISCKQVCIQGLGFVGAAMAVAVAMARGSSGDPIYSVTGVDLNTTEGQERIDAINSGKFPFLANDSKLESAVRECVNAKTLRATSDPSVYRSADIVVVDIPLDLPFLENKPELRFNEFADSLKTVFEQVKSGALVVIETTVPPGTCEKVVKPLLGKELEKRGLPEDAVHLAHSFERVMPGEEYLDSVVNYWRVYAGNTDIAAQKCEEFLSNVINIEKFPLTRLSSLTASETTKVLENTYRAANIAFIQEWTEYSEEIGIDLYEILDAIRVRPTHSNIRFPGIGVGGYCLTKDPMFAPAAARQLFNLPDAEFPFAELATKVNQKMPIHCAKKLEKLVGGKLETKKLLVLGVAYRPDVGDTRYSPVEPYVRWLESQGAEVLVSDPYVEYWEEMEKYSLPELPDATLVDAVIFCVAHRQFKDLDLAAWMGRNRPCIQDLAAVLSKANRQELRATGCIVESIGRGKAL
jgi:UDP-N-acetyl-D-glucosamine dehydrogenase